MELQVEKILKRKTPKQIGVEIKSLKAAVKKRFNLKDFNIPEAESAISFMHKLIFYVKANTITKTARYKAYEESGKKVNYTTFLKY